VTRPVVRIYMSFSLIKSYPVSSARVCKVIDLTYFMLLYESFKEIQPVIDKLNEFDSMRINFQAVEDYRYYSIRYKRIPLNYTRVLRVYLAMGFKHIQRTKRRPPKLEKQPLGVPIGCNMSCSMYFNFASHGVVRMSEKVIREYRVPMNICVTKGPS
jgi:hypothetical protein